MSSGRLPFDADEPLLAEVSRADRSREPAPPASALPEPSLPEAVVEQDAAARRAAVDPHRNVALQASAGTGKTRVLVDRFVNLLQAGVDPANILAITFTRKAAAEMRERIVATLRLAAERGEVPQARWTTLRDRLADIAISTIDAFCLSLLREFPLEADLDPGFRMADDTEVPRLMDEAIDRTLRIGRALAQEDEGVAFVFRQLGDRRVRQGLAALLSRRLVAPSLLDRFLDGGTVTADDASARLVQDLRAAWAGVPGGLDAFLDCAPVTLSSALLRMGLEAHVGAEGALAGGGDAAVPAAAPAPAHDEAVPLPALVAALTDYMLTQDGEPRRGGFTFRKAEFATEAAYKRHRDMVVALAPAIHDALQRHRRAVNQVASSGVRRLFQIARREYRRTLDAHAALDFPDVLERACDLLRQMDEFAQSRFRLEGRYHHILVDEFQDTSHAQWELVSLLIRSWREGAGVAGTGPLEPSIFVVGDPKQSIYGFRDADPAILHDAALFMEGLRPGRRVRESIARSFRSVPAVLAFVNDLCAGMAGGGGDARDAFRYDDADRFPVADSPSGTGASTEAALCLLAGETPEACAADVVAEIRHLLGTAVVRDRTTGVARAARPGDVAILFRSRESHRAFEAALEAAGIRAHVYKGLGFFDADEVKDALALLWCLADPQSDLRVAAWLRSRLIGLTDAALACLAPRLAEAATTGSPTPDGLSPGDGERLDAARTLLARWLPLVDVLPPAELLDRVLADSAYHAEMRGARAAQATENLKKLRGLVRRLQNRGYATLARVVEYIDRLSLGDESNAVIDATDAVNLMTVHASKGLEFPIVFVVNLARGTGNWRDPIRISAGRADDDAVSVAIGAFQSDADEERPDREREETKRLLYVALTRARERLYLASVLKDGRPQPGRGSLAEVMPASLLDLFGGAARAGIATTEWRGPSGQAHVFRCGAAALPEPAEAVAPAAEPAWVDYTRLEAPPTARAVTTLAEMDAGEADAGRGDATGAGTVRSARPGAVSDRLAGVVVHRIMERWGGRAVTLDEVRARLPELVDSDLLPDAPPERDALAARALAAYQALIGVAELTALLASGEVHHEVPFSFRSGGELHRGVLDCLVRAPGGPVTVIEFKTGRPRAEHQTQVAAYRSAAERLFPGTPVDVRVFYSGQ
jgi:ATP-dependent helicase/nuclease subunit A